MYRYETYLKNQFLLYNELLIFSVTKTNWLKVFREVISLILRGGKAIKDTVHENYV